DALTLENQFLSLFFHAPAFGDVLDKSSDVMPLATCRVGEHRQIDIGPARTAIFVQTAFFDLAAGCLPLNQVTENLHVMLAAVRMDQIGEGQIAQFLRSIAEHALAGGIE